MDNDGAIITSRRPASSVMMTVAIVVAIRRSIGVAGIMLRAMMPVTRVVMGRTIAVARVWLRGTMAILASGLTKAVRRARSPMRRTDGLLSVLVEDRHAIMVLHDGAAIFAILVNKYRCTAVFDGCSEVLPVWRKYRRRLSEGRSRAEDKERYCQSLFHTVLHLIIKYKVATLQLTRELGLFSAKSSIYATDGREGVRHGCRLNDATGQGTYGPSPSWSVRSILAQVETRYIP